MLTLVELSDVTGKPKVKMELPSPLRIGDRVRLGFCLRRQQGGRSEVLEVMGEYHVDAVGFDFVSRTKRQVLAVSSVGTVPHWKAVKKRPEPTRRVPPAVSPPKMIDD